MNNAERRQHIRELADQPEDENAVHQVIAALDDEATLYPALRALKQMGTPQALEALDTCLRLDEREPQFAQRILEVLGNNPIDGEMERLYQRFERLPLAVCLSLLGVAQEAEWASFQRWRAAQPLPLITMMLIDDDRDTMWFVRMIVSRAVKDIVITGYALDGQQGCELAAMLKPDVILVDNMMPGMTCIETIEQLRVLVPQSKLILSDIGMPGLLEMAKAAGARGYIVRPITNIPGFAQLIRDTYNGQESDFFTTR